MQNILSSSFVRRFIILRIIISTVDIKKIFAGRDVKIFHKLKNYRLAFKKCQARIKKKLKSESKAEAKKS
jgi:hypothetical protein